MANVFTMRLAILLLHATVAAGALTCETGFQRHGDTCFFFSHDSELYESAYVTCISMGAQLVEINDAAKDTYLRSIAAHTQHYFYIGATDKLVEGQWRWQSSGKLLSNTFSNWRSGEPNNHHGDQSCAVLVQDGWGDEQCETKHNYICETQAQEGPLIG